MKSKINVRNRTGLIAALVVDIATEPFQPRYRRRPSGEPVTGWEARLKAYFWPNRNCGFEATMERTAPLSERGHMIVAARRPWDTETEKRAVDFAHCVLKWGGVPQRTATSATIDAVIQAALTGEPGNAPMNSGWTKVAFATAHLEKQGGSQAIWDSRVSWALLRRMDGLLTRGGWNKVPTWLAHIGRVPDHGGIRRRRPFV